jgi:hypothetical protein
VTTFWLPLLSSLAVFCAALWRLALFTRPASYSRPGAHALWAAYGVAHIGILMSVAMRAARLLAGVEPFELNTALFYLLVASVLAFPVEVKACRR